MVRRLALVMFAAMVAACSSASDLPMEPIPSTPMPSPGWSSIGGMTGAGGPGWQSGGFTIDRGPAMLAATCTGSGTLIVVVYGGGLTPLAVSTPAGAHPSLEVPCESSGVESVSRLSLDDLVKLPGDVTVSAAILEGAGALRRSAFAIAIEQSE